jgi:hypothetical protein
VGIYDWHEGGSDKLLTAKDAKKGREERKEKSEPATMSPTQEDFLRDLRDPFANFAVTGFLIYSARYKAGAPAIRPAARYFRARFP